MIDAKTLRCCKDDKRCEILRSEYVLRDRHLVVLRDKIRQPTGVEIDDYWVLEYPEWINVIAMDGDGRMIMERQYRHAMGWTAYEIPAGCAEAGETPLEAAQRELAEETGYMGGEWELLMTISPNGTSMNNLTYCFVAKGVEAGRAHREATEDIDVILMEPEEVRRLLEAEEIVQATMVAPLWRYFATR